MLHYITCDLKVRKRIHYITCDHITLHVILRYVNILHYITCDLKVRK